ncbi:MAG: tRNA (adenosine(37)-N6)-threonylcarbamoyltransferase complex ATPase subunit type 1 TsaE [Chitinophagia bacterium]|nr:tRNA (adenosine(37)-N6)-threonylcarbamoyltransferase complex ATPase subunit type 1 TsaE [Chitinophagia bacterium]
MDKVFGMSELDEVAGELLGAFPGAKVFAFHGSMGAGKTTLIARICRILGVKAPASSPTFSLVNEYPLASGGCIHHMDLYRLEDEREAFEAGLEETLHSGDTCLVEWPERAPGILPPDTVNVWLEVQPDGHRRIRVQIPARNG